MLPISPLPPRWLTPLNDDHTFKALHKRYWIDGVTPITDHDPASNDNADFDFIDLANLDLYPHILVTTNAQRRLLVLEQYPYFDQRIEAIRRSKGYCGVVLNGGPGNGKTCFLAYLLIQYLHKKQTVFLSLASRFYAFTEDGAFLVTSLTPLRCPKYARAPVLLDSKSHHDKPPPELSSCALFPIQISSRRDAEHYYWSYKREAISLVMNPLRTTELLALAKLRSFPAPPPPPETITALVSLYGPSLHSIFEILQTSPAAFDAKLSQHLRTLTLPDLIRLVGTPKNTCRISDLFVQSTSYTPPPPSTSAAGSAFLLPDLMVHFVHSRHIFRKIWLQYYVHERPDQSWLHPLQNHFSFLSVHTPMQRWVFESWCHTHLSQLNNGKLTLSKMSLSADEKYLVPGNKKLTLKIQNRQMKTYPSCTLAAHTQNTKTYYLPQESNNPTFDSFIRPSNKLGVGFQITTLPNQTLKDNATRGLALLAARLQTKKRYFVFVVPMGTGLRGAFRCVVPSAYWRSKFKFYTLEMDCPGISHGDELWTTDADTERDSDPPPAADMVMDMTE